MRTAYGFAVVLLLSALPAAAACPEGSLKVGLRTTTIGGKVNTIWYPTTTAESSYVYSSLMTGSVAQNAAVATCDKFPLIAFSHGDSGCSTQSVFITETLARKGYIVAAPNHADAVSCNGSGDFSSGKVDPPFSQPNAWTDQTFIDRRNDMKATVDFMLSNPEWAAVVDPNRIGGMGHSLGGYTMFGLGGGWDSWTDPRYKALLLLSPYIDPYIVQNRIPRMRVPAMYQGGTLDAGITPSIDGSRYNGFDQTNMPKLFIELRQAGHFEWTNTACRGQSTVANCIANVSTVQNINNYGLNFFDRYLNSIERPALWQSNSGLSTYRRLTPVTTVSAASYDASSAIAPDSLVSAFGDGLSTQTLTSSAATLPTVLGNVSVNVQDSTGRSRQAQIYLVSPNQINFLVPSDIDAGTLTVNVRTGSEVVSMGNPMAQAVAPSLFAANASGKGVPAGQYLLVNDGGRSTNYLYDQNLNPVPLDLASGDIYLLLYGTGFRRGSSNTTATIAGRSIPVLGFAAQGQYVGLDQINLGPLPKDLPSGMQDLVITINGVKANTLQVMIK